MCGNRKMTKTRLRSCKQRQRGPSDRGTAWFWWMVHLLQLTMHTKKAPSAGQPSFVWIFFISFIDIFRGKGFAAETRGAPQAPQRVQSLHPPPRPTARIYRLLRRFSGPCSPTGATFHLFSWLQGLKLASVCRSAVLAVVRRLTGTTFYLFSWLRSARV